MAKWLRWALRNARPLVLGVASLSISAGFIPREGLAATKRLTPAPFTMLALKGVHNANPRADLSKFSGLFSTRRANPFAPGYGSPFAMDDQPCYQYIIPPDDCTDGAGNYGGGNGDASDSDGSAGTVWPSSVYIIGTYNGLTVVGYAERQGNSSTYDFVVVGGAFGHECAGLGTISMSVFEAIMIDLNHSVTFSSWQMDEWDCT